MVHVNGVRPEIHREFAFHPQDIAETHCPVIGKRIRGDELPGKSRPLVLILRIHVCLRLALRRDASGEIKVETADHHAVGRGSVRMLPHLKLRRAQPAGSAFTGGAPQVGRPDGKGRRTAEEGTSCERHFHCIASDSISKSHSSRHTSATMARECSRGYSGCASSHASQLAR